MLLLKSKLINAIQNIAKTAPFYSQKINAWITLLEKLPIPDTANAEIFILILYGILIPHTINLINKKKLKKFKLTYLYEEGLKDLIELDLSCLIEHRLSHINKEDALIEINKALDLYYTHNTSINRRAILQEKKTILNFVERVYDNIEYVNQIKFNINPS